MYDQNDADEFPISRVDTPILVDDPSEVFFDDLFDLDDDFFDVDDGDVYSNFFWWSFMYWIEYICMDAYRKIWCKYTNTNTNTNNVANDVYHTCHDDEVEMIEDEGKWKIQKGAKIA